MKTIEERAKELSIIDDDGWCVRDANIEAACTQIANEVVDKACEFWHKVLVNDNDPYKSMWLALIDKFRKDMTTVPCDSSQVEKKGE